MDLVQTFITAIPTELRDGAIAATFVRNGLFSVNHDGGIAEKARVAADFLNNRR
jgi:hypothetical protein